MQISEYMWTDTSFFKNGGVGMLGFLVPNIVRVGVFIVSDNLLFVSQIEYNRTKRKEKHSRVLYKLTNEVINMQDFISNLEELINNARAKVIGQYESTYGANVEYAQLLNQKWGFDWFELKHTDTSDEGKAVKAEGDRFRKGIKDWHSNPSTAWKQIREHARVDRYGKK